MVTTLFAMPEVTSPLAGRPATVATPSMTNPNAQNVLEIDGVDFCYGAAKALHDVTLNIKEREVTAFIGPSGCGKSTLLRCLNRMNDLIDGTRVTKGQIRIDGVNIYDSRVDVIELKKPARVRFQKTRRHGVSEIESFSEIDLRQHHLRAAHPGREAQIPAGRNRGEKPAGR